MDVQMFPKSRIPVIPQTMISTVTHTIIAIYPDRFLSPNITVEGLNLPLMKDCKTAERLRRDIIQGKQNTFPFTKLAPVATSGRQSVGNRNNVGLYYLVYCPTTPFPHLHDEWEN